MEEKLILEPRELGYDYYNHKIFETLSDLEVFYEFISDSSSGIPNGMIVTSKLSIDSLIYSSLQGSMESIKILVYIGRLNDAFTLVRKYYDAVNTDIYKSILIKDEESDFFIGNANFKDLWTNSVVRAWTYAQEHLYDLTSKKNTSNRNKRTYIDVNSKMKETNLTLYNILNEIKNNDEKSLCNDNVHYNSLDNFVLNHNNILNKKPKLKALDDLYENIQIVLCIHFSYIYLLHPEYYSSTDYIDALECGNTPESNSQYWVAPIIQDVFDKYIKMYSKKLSDFILGNKIMRFE